ncbi:MAG: PD-(D/E)XK nuclease family protein [Conexivisphaera sp.]
MPRAGSSLRAQLLDLLDRDKEFRYAVAGKLGLSEILERLDRNEEAIRKLWEEVRALREGQEKLWENYEKLAQGQEKLWEEVKALREGQEKLWESNEKLQEGQEKLWEEVRALSTKLDALGARWGISSEEAFREGVRGILRNAGFEVERWTYRDEEGIVYGFPSDVEVDASVRNGVVILVEIKSHVGKSDIAPFLRKAELYSRVTGRRPARLIMVSPYVDSDAAERGAQKGIEIYSGTHSDLPAKG